MAESGSFVAIDLTSLYC